MSMNQNLIGSILQTVKKEEEVEEEQKKAKYLVK